MFGTTCETDFGQAVPRFLWDRIYLLETFVDPERFRGTCYRAANWKVLGETTGRGKDDLTHRQNRSIKQVLALPPDRRFRQLLSA